MERLFGTSGGPLLSFSGLRSDEMQSVNVRFGSDETA
jgi:hypothetical protein